VDGQTERPGRQAEKGFELVALFGGDV